MRLGGIEFEPVPGFGQRYFVGEDGTIINTETGRPLKPIRQSNGYCHVTLYGENGPKQFRLHRIVAEAFCKKPDGCDIVNHKDFDKTNNAATNLEWVTQKENIAHSANHGRRTEAMKKARMAAWNAMSKPVEATEIETGYRKVYKAISDVVEDGCDPSCVSKCCRNLLRQHKGRKWRYLSA